MKKSVLFLEILSEEMPANMQTGGSERLLSLIIQNLGAKDAKSEVYSTPMRIVIHIEYINTENGVEEVRGPKIDAPEHAVAGFMTKHNVLDKATLNLRDGYFYHYIERSVVSHEVHAKRAVEAAMSQMVWPKSMFWGANQVAWVRPIKSIICLVDNKVLDVEYGDIRGANHTIGHRFMAPDEVIISSCDIDQYISKMRDKYVIIDHNERKRVIVQKSIELFDEVGCSILQDDALIDEIVGLVEYPAPVLAKVPERFMSLPPEVLRTTIRNNQKYIMSYDRYGNLSPYFIVIANIISTDGMQSILNGNLKVVNSRLDDAAFFYNTDRQTHLLDWAKGLTQLTYHKDFGSVADKLAITQDIALKIVGILSRDRTGIDKEKVIEAISIMKADLCTNMVKEFPELQGIMGYYYAKNEGREDTVCNAIRDHYKPIGQSDFAPTALLSAIIAMADKLSSLVILFQIGIKPSGSKDPYALRRNALGIIKCMLANNIHFSLKELCISEDIRSFIVERLRWFIATQSESKDAELLMNTLN